MGMIKFEWNGFVTSVHVHEGLSWDSLREQLGIREGSHIKLLFDSHYYTQISVLDDEDILPFILRMRSYINIILYIILY